MKLSIFFVAILGFAAVSAVPTGKVHARSTSSLSDDWADFMALVPTSSLLEIAITYLATDAEVQQVLVYVQSEDFKALVEAVDAIPEYIAFLDYLEAAGLDAYNFVNIIHQLIGLDGLKTPTSSVSRGVSSRITGGIAGLWADIKAVLPLTELRALFEDKLENSPDFANLITLLKCEEAQSVYSALKANEEYQSLRAKLVEFGLDIDAFFNWLRALINWA